MQRATLMKIGKRVLQIGLPVVVLIFFAIFIEKGWSQVTAQSFQWNPWFLLLSFVGFLLQTLSYGVIWQTILARLGYHLDFRVALRIYLASEFVRYIPGNVWHVLTRVLWAGQYKIPRSVAFASMVIELVTKLAAGAFVFALSLVFWGDLGAVQALAVGAPFIIGLGVLLMVALLIGLHPRVLQGILRWGLRLLKREPITIAMRYRDILAISFYWCVSWLIAGGAFYALVIALWPRLPLAALPICIGVYALAWDIGFLSFITPSGLGFREGAIAALFKLALPVIPVALVTIIAILSRLVSTLAELVCVSLAYLSGGRQLREVQQEREEQHALSAKPVGDSAQGGQ